MEIPEASAGGVIRAVLVALTVATSGTTAADLALLNRAVGNLDLQRYGGRWHEIAHLPMFFQRHCVDTITATYTPQSDGSIEVRNACRTRDGTIDEAKGTAHTVEGAPGQLQVRFAPRWLSWLPMVWADYWVIDLDPDYRWAVVGEPGAKYLWILSRTPVMERALFDRLSADAARRGYAVEKLVMSAELE